MKMSIRWKLILSISIPMLVVYIAMLTWEHSKLTDTVRREVQRDVAERARMAAWVIDHALYSIQQSAEANASAIAASNNKAAADLMSRGLITMSPRGAGWVYASLLIPDQPTAKPAAAPPGGPVAPLGPGLRPPGAPGPRPLSGTEALADAMNGGPMMAGKKLSKARVQPLSDRVDLTKTDWYQKAKNSKKTVWSKPFTAPTPNGPLVVACASPIVGEAGVKGVLALTVNVQDLQRIDAFPNATPADRKKTPAVQPLESTLVADDDDDEPQKVDWSPLAVAPDGFVILDQDGRLISHKSPALVQKESVFTLAKKRGIPSIVQAGERAKAGESGVVRVQGLNDVIPGYTPDEYHWLAFAPIPTTRWIFAAAIPESSVMEPIYHRLAMRGGILLGGLLLMMFIVTAASIRMSRPIERMARAVRKLAEGNLDVQVEGVKNRDEIGQLARTFNHMVTELRHHIDALTAETAARSKVESELLIARRIQSDLLPSTFPPFPDRPEFDLHAINVPARQVAGDFFDFFFNSRGQLIVVVADVSGKGVPAALFMAITRTIVRNLAMEGVSPATILHRANAMLVEDSTANGMFVTMVVLQYDPATGQVVYANAGHPLPYRLRENGAMEPFGEVTAPILGVTAGGEMGPFEQREQKLERGDTLMVYTDGVTEALSADGRLLRAAGVERILQACPRDGLETLCRCVVKEVDAYQSGVRSDDVTVLALRRNV
jgi:sigma-B regulation protein RsbU (phosphoserine phosphatase)